MVDARQCRERRCTQCCGAARARPGGKDHQPSETRGRHGAGADVEVPLAPAERVAEMQSQSVDRTSMATHTQHNEGLTRSYTRVPLSLHTCPLLSPLAELVADPASRALGNWSFPKPWAAAAARLRRKPRLRLQLRRLRLRQRRLRLRQRRLRLRLWLRLRLQLLLRQPQQMKLLPLCGFRSTLAAGEAAVRATPGCHSSNPRSKRPASRSSLLPRNPFLPRSAT